MDIIGDSTLVAHALDFLGDRTLTLHFWDVLNTPIPEPILALIKNVKDPNVIGQMQNAWNTFVKSGQCWALLIGAFFGYMVKSLTAF
jgi:hypothetical protein